MPISENSPYCVWWNIISPESGPERREIYCEDILPLMVEGYTPEEIAASLDVRLDRIDHLICEIPHMMAWRSTEGAARSKKIEEESWYKALPRNERDLSPHRASMKADDIDKIVFGSEYGSEYPYGK